MSIFDVIKYPINEEFELEDLKRIPAPALVNWWFDDIMKIQRFRQIATGYSAHPEDIARMAIYITAEEAKYLTPMVQLLRKRIEQL